MVIVFLKYHPNLCFYVCLCVCVRVRVCTLSPVSQAPNGTDDSLLRGLHGGSSPPAGGPLIQASSIPMLSACFNKLFSMLQVHHVQV